LKTHLLLLPLFLLAVAGPAGAIAENAPAPALDGRLFDGASFSLAENAGKVIVLNFWATWCAPCREEMPLLDKIARQQSAGGLQVLGIAWDRAANVADYARQHQTNYPLLVASDRATALLPALGNPAQGLPFSLLVAADGSLRRLHLGAFQTTGLDGFLKDHSVANGSKMR